MRSNHLYFLAAALFCGVLSSAHAQLSFTSGVNPAAGPNANYAASRFYNFSNMGGIGEFSGGTGNNSFGTDYQTWAQQSWGISVSYDPTHGIIQTSVFGGAVACAITIPSAQANELQIIDSNTGIGNLVLNLTSINSVANGGVIGGAMDPEVYGGTENFASGTAWSAANGTTLQAYLYSPNLFSSGFTLNGTITLDAAPNSINYGDNLNSLIQFNLTSAPEPSTALMFTIGAGALVWLRRKGFAT